MGKLKDGNIRTGELRDMDYQMRTIEQVLYRQKARVLGAERPIYEATEVIYEAIDARIAELVAQTNYSCQYVILMGGILINVEVGVGSFNATCRLNLKTGERRSLMDLEPA